jgi:hypothetical protein
MQPATARHNREVSKWIQCHFDIKGCDRELMLLKSLIGVVGNFAFN